jgi:cation:H+ antiporter
MMTYLLFAVGLAGLFFGGEYLVRGASSIARHFGLSPMVIGLTVVGFGTSAPELLVSVQAALEGQPDIAIGNVLGSNIANILLILGVSGLIAPLLIPWRNLRRDIFILLGSTAIVWLMLSDGVISRIEGAILFAGLIGFLTTAFLAGDVEVDTDATPLPPIWKAAVATLFGLIALVIGAHYLVQSASIIAREFGVSEAVIGLTVVAVGTSLPELATSVIAALRKETDIAVGNVVGSGIFNVFGILGTTALIIPIPADPRFAMLDMPVVAAATILLTLLAYKMGGVSRIAAGVLLACYAGYLAFMS